ncbi:RagB/SusD family nutrient uptake outer membrane protein [Euzebyella marina]|uniref:RagB/SusD family nutrient uptake outer membrane protein n=1 Tax=Euzebyella marina TaxID=1761453 RepID=A0A3G2L243_9FLAO|nr:RagB/SusD family nutrient uptake outer membrane protein [Euzebyella marina]AYN66334.1 RagB/SusD family nutrient uptake outer membrane protein [Euzebyella marina]MBG47705.1 RagB/SusD family nutrient uptake outer membrane protein [Pseudozobellia sp.]|tara:strand:- start:2083 stop:3570 length:1488 start_codon:yes stop_codon:yes gene_type:complete
MKNNKIILTILASLGLVFSCNEDSLELTNPNELSPDTFFQNPVQVQSAVNAVYSNLQTQGLYSRHMFFMMDNMAHENGGNTQLEADKRQYLDFSFDSSHGAIGAYWESCYRGINKANFVIENAETINAILPSVMSTEDKQKAMGEAKFLRALFYFLIVTRFGDAPLITTLPPDDGVGFPKSSAEEIYAQIIQDLQEAIPTLKLKGEEENGRATKGAAQGLLGKVYLFLERYDDALTQFNALNGYSLEDDYFNNFKEETEFGPESIFEIQYDDDLGFSAQWNSDRSGEGPNEATFRGQEYGFNDWFNVFPSDDLLNEYEEGDIRFEQSFYVNGDTFGPDSTLTVDHFPSNAGGNAGWSKYNNYYKDANEDQTSGINFKYMRYADVLLMMAECESMRPGGDQDTAVGLINQVRERAGLDPLPTGLSQTQVFDALIHERKVELAGEQCRFNDIIRWGVSDTELAGTNFQAGKHELLPIPQAEIDANINLTSADQNPGY